MPSSDPCDTASKNGSKKNQQQHIRNLSSSSSSSSSSSDSLFSELSSDVSLHMPSPPDGGYGWMIVFSAFMVNLISDGISFSFGILYTELLTYFGESKSLTSWVGSIFYGTCLMGGPLASALATKFGCRKVMMIGGFVAAGSTFLSAFVDDVRTLYFTFGLVTGLGMSMGYVISVVMVAFYFEDKRALATGISVCGSGIGTFVMAPFTEYLIAEYGWRGTMIIWSGIILNLVICGALMRPLEFTAQEKKQRALQRFERFSRTMSYSSFSNAGRSMSRLASNVESLDSDSDHLEDDGLEHCHSQIQIPTFMMDNKVHIPIDVLKEAQHNKNKLKEYYKKLAVDQASCEDECKKTDISALQVESNDEFGEIKSYDEPEINPPEVYTNAMTKIANGHEQIGLVNGMVNEQVLERQANGHIPEKKPRGCLKKSATTPGGGKDTAGLSSKPLSKPKQVRMSSYLPLYRKDLFFRGNLARLTHPAGQVRSTSCPELYKGRREDSDSDSSDDEWESVCWRYLKFSKHMKRVLKTLFDPSILLNPLYVMFAISNFILYFWYDIPYIFLADRALEFGMSESKASFLISVLGIVNTFGQIFYGFLGDRNLDLSLLYGVTIMLCGVSVLLVPIFTRFVPLAVLSGLFGLFISANYALSTVILVEYLGLDKLSNAYGLTMLVQGIANLIGPPVAAFLYDCTGSYDTTFYMGGASILLSGLILLIVPGLRHCQNKLAVDIRTRLYTIHNSSYKVKDLEVTIAPPGGQVTQLTTCSTLLIDSQETTL